MKLDIPYYIRQVLREQRKVYVPGIGTFRLEQSASSFVPDKSILSPPSLNVTFEEGESSDQSLMTYILDGDQVTPEKAQKKLAEYTQAAFNKLLNVDSFRVEGLGKLVKKSGFEKVEFEPEVDALTREFKGLKPINLKPIQRIGGQTAAVNAQPVTDDEGTGVYFWRIILLSILLISLFLLFETLKKDTSVSQTVPETGLMMEDTGELGGGQNPDDLDKRYAEIDELIEPVTKGGIDVSDITNTTLDSNLKVVGGNRTDIGRTDEGKGKDTRVDMDDAAKNNPIKEDPKAAMNKHADIIPASGECIIIVGSFIKSLNAIKMISKLERKGLKVYQSEFEGFKRVGFRYTCENEDLEAYLQNIRKTISKEAWYLSPELEVPYENR